MTHSKKALITFLAVILFVIPRGAYAGPYSNELTRCVMETTTEGDRVALASWVFSVMSLHPAIRPIAKLSEQQIDGFNKQAAELFMRLLTESCREQTQKAIKYEGQMAIHSTFQVLGQVAMKELLSNPEVAAGMEGLTKYLDEEKLKVLDKSK